MADSRRPTRLGQTLGLLLGRTFRAGFVQVVRPSAKSLEWHHSEFPHELVTLDFNKDGELIAVTLVGTLNVRIDS